MEFIYNIRKDGTQEYIHPNHDAIIAASLERDKSEEVLSNQIVFTEQELRDNEIRYNNYLNQEYLLSTDWIAAKYTDEVVILKTMTDDQFNEKYSEILEKRRLARSAITPI